jgi:hypothetical protein
MPKAILDGHIEEFSDLDASPVLYRTIWLDKTAITLPPELIAKRTLPTVPGSD